MTTQEAYEKIRAYFTRENAVIARGVYAGCSYRLDLADQVAMCAVGCLIPDALYDPEMESKFAGAVVDWNDATRAFFADTEESFLCAAQRRHDLAASVEHFVSRLDDLAVDFDLTPVAA